MASFPDSVKSFAARSSGQTIDASHVGDLQDEVNAIESGYLNGTARLNSSASTLASLDVNGNSTLASSITLGAIPYVFPSSGGSTGDVLTCVSTSGSTMGLEWRPVTSVAEAARVELSAQVALAASSAAVAWNQQVFVTNSSIHSTGTNPSRLTPQSTGIFQFTAVCTFEPGASGSTRHIIYIEDSSATVVGQFDDRFPSPQKATYNLSCLKRFDVTGGWCRVVVAPQGSTSQLVGGAESHFSMVKL